MYLFVKGFAVRFWGGGQEAITAVRTERNTASIDPQQTRMASRASSAQVVTVQNTTSVLTVDGHRQIVDIRTHDGRLSPGRTGTVQS